MTTLVKVPCEDGAEYDLYVEPPAGMEAKNAVEVVEDAVNRYFESEGSLELMPELERLGFTMPSIYKTEVTW